MSSSFFASAPQNIELGNKVSINRAVHLDGTGGLTIGSRVLIGPNVKIYSANHHFSVGTDIFSTPLLSKSRVTIGNNVWIGANVIILPGVSVPNNTVIAGGSVVTKCDVEEHKIYAGNPAKIVGEWPNAEDK